MLVESLAEPHPGSDLAACLGLIPIIFARWLSQRREARAGGVEQRAAGGSGSLLPQHFCFRTNFRRSCNCNLVLSVELQEISADMPIKYLDKIFCVMQMAAFSFWAGFPSFLCCLLVVGSPRKWRGNEELQLLKHCEIAPQPRRHFHVAPMRVFCRLCPTEAPKYLMLLYTFLSCKK